MESHATIYPCLGDHLQAKKRALDVADWHIIFGQGVQCLFCEQKCQLYEEDSFTGRRILEAWKRCKHGKFVGKKFKACFPCRLVNREFGCSEDDVWKDPEYQRVAKLVLP